MDGKAISIETWLVEVERRMRFSAVENKYDAKCYLSVYMLLASSMQLHTHTFMQGVDVAQNVLAVIFTPPFRMGGTGTGAEDNKSVFRMR